MIDVVSSVDTFTATIYIGRKVGYDSLGFQHSQHHIFWACKHYVDDVGLAVTVTPTQYIYTGGHEDGVAVGLINYPRFPSSPSMITYHAKELAQKLMVELDQIRCTVVCSDRTYLLENDELAEDSDALA